MYKKNSLIFLNLQFFITFLCTLEIPNEDSLYFSAAIKKTFFKRKYNVDQINIKRAK